MGANLSSFHIFGAPLSIDSYISELSDIQYRKSLSSARFMKTVRCQHLEGPVVVKLFVKPSSSYTLKSYIEQVESVREKLLNIPNAIPYRRVFETEKAGYLVREFFFSSLYDRISTRPFLQMIEKKWIVFQLLSGLRDCHSKGVYHGDIKIENVMVTSWNWVYLVDFSFFKPNFLPEDNPADFSYFYDSSSRRVCYIAPERFLCSSELRHGELTDKMDIFSLGCVIAELFLEGIPLFTLSQLLKYKQGRYNPISTLLNKIEDLEIKSLICHMINLDPEKRLSAQEYLEKWRNSVFPDYFFTFLYQYINSIMQHSQKEHVEFKKKMFYMDDYIERIYHDLDKIAYSLGFEDYENVKKVSFSKNLYGNSITQFEVYEHSIPLAKPVSSDNGVLIFLSLIMSSIRNLLKPISRIIACHILLIFSYRITDETKHDLCLPYLAVLLNDDVPSVRMSSLYTITKLLASIIIITPINIHVFLEYILPMLNPLVTDPKSCVRILYASCISSIVNTAQRFLNIAEAFRLDGILEFAGNDIERFNGSTSSMAMTYDSSLNDLQDAFKQHVMILLTDTNSDVRRALMGSIASLLKFFYKQNIGDAILSHLITYLNDKDWMLRYSFFEHIASIALYVGSQSLEEYIMPLIIQALIDIEEFVVEKVISSLTSIMELGLFQKPRIWDLLVTLLKYTLHPNVWIRTESIKFIVASIKWLEKVDIHCILYSLLRPFLRCDIINITETALLENLHTQIPRFVFDTAIAWAARNEKSLFWKSAKSKELFVSTQYVDENDIQILFPSAKCVPLSEDEIEKTMYSHERMNISKDDEEWIIKLRDLGMTISDEWKLNLLKEYIWKVAHLSSSYRRHDNSSIVETQDGFVSLKTLDIHPKIVFSDNLSSKSKIKISQLTNTLAFEDKSEDFNKFTDKQSEDALTPSFSKNNLSVIFSNEELIPHVISDNSNIDLVTTNSSFHEERSFSTDDKQVEIGFCESSSDTKEVSNNLINIKPFLDSRISESEENRIFSSKNDESCLDNKQHNSNLIYTKTVLLNKTVPETSTNTENVLGILESFLNRYLTSNIAKDASDGEIDLDLSLFSKSVYSSDENDKDIFNFLNKIFVDNSSEEIKDFDSIVSSQKINIKKNSGKLSINTLWRPVGTLIAHFSEHSKGINRVIVSADNVFFATGSDDGTVKIWDISRLKKNVTNRSRLTYQHSMFSRIISLCFISNTHCIASGANDGSLHIIKVECITNIGPFPKYRRIKILRKYEIGKDEYAVWMEHFETDHESILMIATNMSRVIALDIRTMKELYNLLNPPQHGMPTCFCIDQQKTWLLLAGTHGILDLWDLRFQIRLKSWGLHGASKIHRLLLHPTKGHGKWVCIAGGNSQHEVTVWDIEKAQCREIYRVVKGKDTGKGYELWEIDSESSEKILRKYIENINNLSFDNKISGDNRGVCAMIVGISGMSHGITSNIINHGFIIFSGTDQKIRFWNLDSNETEKGFIISGLEPGEKMPIYTTTNLTSTLVLNTEQPISVFSADEPVSLKSFSKISRSALIQQQNCFLKNHIDLIQDIAFIDDPYKMIISVDRSGTINVYG
ncbi:hypothetical protein PNEG_00773 [Pneumocystis murina B123]|uniref:non-specific serine/threonine protein kinase n=1 Tax=Pneumocystis murina (strain B123) TaxID=1069680 RepID=M7PBB4_PNEMU|nr:hypothetical protein PNEG_00773 [Pneumocystis murina B123]EMR11180.1 hypothetical protein PNEG_00773 [Pneumocystis murina B123]